MSHAQVKGLLNIALNGYATLKGYKVNWENVDTSTIDRNVYPRLETYLMPALNSSMTLDGDLEDVSGIYQVTVVTRKWEGTGPSDLVIADIHKLFPVYKVYKAANGFSFQTLDPVNIAEGRSDGDTWRVPCWFTYKAITNSKEIS